MNFRREREAKLTGHFLFIEIMQLCPSCISRSLGLWVALLIRVFRGKYLTMEGGSLLGHALIIYSKKISQSPVAILTLYTYNIPARSLFPLSLTVLSAVCHQTGIFRFFEGEARNGAFIKTRIVLLTVQ